MPTLNVAQRENDGSTSISQGRSTLDASTAKKIALACKMVAAVRVETPAFRELKALVEARDIKQRNLPRQQRSGILHLVEGAEFTGKSVALDGLMGLPELQLESGILELKCPAVCVETPLMANGDVVVAKLLLALGKKLDFVPFISASPEQNRHRLCQIAERHDLRWVVIQKMDRAAPKCEKKSITMAQLVEFLTSKARVNVIASGSTVGLRKIAGADRLQLLANSRKSVNPIARSHHTELEDLIRGFVALLPYTLSEFKLDNETFTSWLHVNTGGVQGKIFRDLKRAAEIAIEHGHTNVHWQPHVAKAVAERIGS